MTLQDDNTHGIPSLIVVLGLGNPVLTDDGVGLAVIRELEHLLYQDPIPGVVPLATTRAGFELIDMLAGSSLAIIIDCLVMEHPVPGRVRKLEISDLNGIHRLAGSHEISLTSSFELADMLGISMPSDVIVYGIEAEDTVSFSERLSPPVEAAVTPLAIEIHEYLKTQSLIHNPTFDLGERDITANRPYSFYTPWD
jgi:hydrogenase maturation protease